MNEKAVGMGKVADRLNLPEQLDKLGVLVRQVQEALLMELPSPPMLDGAENSRTELSVKLSSHIERVRGLQKQMTGVVAAANCLRDQII